VQTTELFRQHDPFDYRLAVFPLAPVSSCVALGYWLTNRPRVRLFQYHRDEQTWRWPSDGKGQARFSVSGLPRSTVSGTGEVAICIHISARILDQQIAEVERRFAGRIDIRVQRPSTGWLRRESQLTDLARTARGVFEQCATLFPQAKAWHLFCAVPAPVAVALGQQINPTMSPPVQLYEFDRTARPCYRASVVLGATNNGGI